MSTATLQRTTRTTRRDILEYAASGAAHQIDRGRGLIHDVKILGAQSRNGGTYPAAAMSNARPLYEGARVNIDHPDRSNPDQERAFGEWFGVLENVRQLADGLYGDLAYLTSHPLAPQVCEAAERFPGNFGLSHNAQVTEAAREGELVYEAIHRVRSVDIVCKPATTRGIFESEGSSNSLADSAAGFDPAGCGGAPAGDLQDPDAPDWDGLIAQLQDVYSGGGQLSTRMRQAVELVCRVFENADAADGTRQTVHEVTQTDGADRGQAVGGKLESAGRQASPAMVAEAEDGRPRSAKTGTPEAASTGKPDRAARWADPRLAAIALLTR